MILVIAVVLLLMGCQSIDVAVDQDDGPISTAPTNTSVGNTTPDQDDDQYADYPTRRVDVGEVVQLSTNFAFDPDGDRLTYIFPTPFNQTGAWVPTHDDVGTHILTIKVSDGDFTSELDIRVIVDPVNRAPVISNFADIEVQEGDLIELNPEVSDPDGDEVTISLSGFMNTEQYQTTFGDAGNYTVTLTASDGLDESSQTINVIIHKTYRPPVMQDFTPMTIVAGEEVTLNPFAHDPDGNEVTFTYSAPFNEEGTFASQPGDEGIYEVEVTAHDGRLSTTKGFTLTVLMPNRPPVITAPQVMHTQEGTIFTLDVQVTDPDGDPVTVAYSGFMQSSSRYIDYGEAGEHQVIITASDGQATTTKEVTIVVEAVNRPPVFVGDVFV
jgi:hypothetical protein